MPSKYTECPPTITPLNVSHPEYNVPTGAQNFYRPKAYTQNFTAFFLLFQNYLQNVNPSIYLHSFLIK